MRYAVIAALLAIGCGEADDQPAQRGEVGIMTECPASTVVTACAAQDPLVPASNSRNATCSKGGVAVTNCMIHGAGTIESPSETDCLEVCP